jgi:tricarballylate dehydrogenase
VSEAAYDVVVVGAGNAALCAALSARERLERGGGRVLVLEAAPREARGGNSWFTAGLVRFAYEGIDDIAALVDLEPEEARGLDVGHYPEKAFRDDLDRLTEGKTDPALASVLVRESAPTMRWLRSRGARFSLVRGTGRQAFPRTGRLRFWGNAPVEFTGEGNGHVDRLLELAGRAGIEVWYAARANALATDEAGAVRGVAVEREGRTVQVAARAVVLACGGFEANPDLRARHLGPSWADVKVRGTRFNRGDGLTMALEIGAQRAGQFDGCHAVAWDLNAPPTGDLRVRNGFNKHSYPFGIVLNQRGERFLDEGADFRNYTYAKYGRAILDQPGRVAYQVFDARATPLLRDEYHIPEAARHQADSLPELAAQLDVDRDRFQRTVREFNGAVVGGAFDPTCLDGAGTRGLEPPKSNWAQPIDRPPFSVYPVGCGITFTFGGLRIDERARVLRRDGPIPGLYAAGELAGGLFWHNYPGGSGLSAGSVFGRIAGDEAALQSRLP